MSSVYRYASLFSSFELALGSKGVVKPYSEIFRLITLQLLSFYLFMTIITLVGYLSSSFVEMVAFSSHVC